ncbi:MAG: RNase adapter RapZ [Deltaproteobacteria bacterium]|nr:RNase adapter RapZ [Deltaproteobacteria bacterium]
MKLVVVTGLAGAGKTTALKALEDLDFYCADNLPMPLLPRFIELLVLQSGIRQAAIIVDTRSGEFLENASVTLKGMADAGHDIEVLYLDAPDDILIRRFSETRRRHPLAGVNVRSDVEDERRRLTELRISATSVVDTGHLSVHNLRAMVLEKYGRSSDRLGITILSFGFKYGLPAESDMVLDVRFLPNPYFIEALSAGTGQEAPVRDFVLASDEAKNFLDRAGRLLELSIQGFGREGKAYATVAIGCTGGRHRSVAMAEEMARRINHLGNVSVRHRDLGKS